LLSHDVIRRAALAGIAALSIACTATAHTSSSIPTTGLGESWPNATDVSANPNWHVYVFEKDGVRYIQVNDRNGTVHAAVGSAGPVAFALPIGVDAQRVAITKASSMGGLSQPIYHDENLTIEATSQNDGDVQITMAMAPGDDLDPANRTDASLH